MPPELKHFIHMILRRKDNGYLFIKQLLKKQILLQKKHPLLSSYSQKKAGLKAGFLDAIAAAIMELGRRTGNRLQFETVLPAVRIQGRTHTHR